LLRSLILKNDRAITVTCVINYPGWGRQRMDLEKSTLLRNLSTGGLDGDGERTYDQQIHPR
jgi:hypothetical protein